jgi:hypothetical protein
VIELALGFLVAAALGARGAGIAAAGVPIGIVLYFASCLYWDSVPCWWPWCSAWKKTKRGPGRRRRRRWTCRMCGGSGLRRRWGARLMGR